MSERILESDRDVGGLLVPPNPLAEGRVSPFPKSMSHNTRYVKLSYGVNIPQVGPTLCTPPYVKLGYRVNIVGYQGIVMELRSRLIETFT